MKQPYIIYQAIVLLLILWLTNVVFLSGMNGPFLFDDWHVLVNTPFIKNPIHWISSYRPLRNLSYLIDLQFGAFEPRTFHIANLIYHSINILLLHILLQKIFLPKSTPDWLFHMSILVAFAIHPVQIESVVYISGRRDLLYSFFYLSGLLVFILSTNHRWIMLVLFTALSMSSKESGITLPLMGGILMIWQYNTIPQHSIHIKKGKFIVLTFMMILLIGLWIHLLGQAYPVLQAGFMGGNFWTHLLNVSVLLLNYISVVFFPINLAADYSYHAIPLINVSDIHAWLSLCSVFLLSGISMYILLDSNDKRQNGLRQIAFGWLFYLMIMLPMSNIIPHVERFALHYLYLPIVGLWISIIGIIVYLTKYHLRILRIAAFVCCIGTCLLGFKTQSEIHYWLSEMEFWKHNVQVNPSCSRAQTNFGMSLLKANRQQEAAEVFHKALSIAPSTLTYLGLAIVALDRNQLNEAKSYLDRVQYDAKLHKEYLLVKGLVLMGESDFQAVETIAKQLCSDMPEFDGGYYLYGRLTTAKGQYSEAVNAFTQAYYREPLNSRDLLALIQALIQDKQDQQALDKLNEGFEKHLFDSNDTERLNDKGYVLRRLGKLNEAKMYFEKCIEKDKTASMAVLNLTSILIEQKQFEEAFNLSESIDLSKGNSHILSRILNNLAICHLELQQKDKAKEVLLRSIALWPENQNAKKNLDQLKREGE
ncbi:MAG: hypothetical protein HQK77_00700 [Desulfobacterales bacterium]|nr:hypothetical protein [Desulfobacterales bacterium]